MLICLLPPLATQWTGTRPACCGSVVGPKATVMVVVTHVTHVMNLHVTSNSSGNNNNRTRKTSKETTLPSWY